MGLFDFLKPKKNTIDELTGNPELRPFIVEAESQNLVAQCNNLKAVGRSAEASKLAQGFLVKLAQDCVKQPFSSSPIMLSLLASKALILGEAKLGKQLLDRIIEFHTEIITKVVPGAPALDLTIAYTDAGRLAHQIRDDRDEEYRCYWLAAEALPPPGCKEPASRRVKAIAHNFAQGLCSVESIRDPGKWKEREEWHYAKRQEYAPECDWDDTESMIRWIRGDALPS